MKAVKAHSDQTLLSLAANNAHIPNDSTSLAPMTESPFLKKFVLASIKTMFSDNMNNPSVGKKKTSNGLRDSLFKEVQINEVKNSL